MRVPARPLLVVAVLLTAVGATACGTMPAGSGDPGGSSATAPSTAAPAPSADSPSATGSAVPDDVREAPAVVTAVEDAARRRGVPPDEVVVAALTAVTWNDGSLGCPQPDMAYTQALVDGELLVLEVGGARLQYHGRVGGPYTYCAAPSSSGG